MILRFNGSSTHPSVSRVTAPSSGSSSGSPKSTGDVARVPRYSKTASPASRSSLVPYVDFSLGILLSFAVPKAGLNVIVHHAGRLHVCVANGAAHETKAALS